MLDPTQLRRFAHQCRTDAVEYRELASTVLRRDTRERLLMSAAIREDDAEFYELKSKENSHGEN